MKMFIPEIGNDIILENDWSFTLHSEYRNNDLGQYFGHYLYAGGWVDQKELPRMRDADYNVNYPTDEELFKHTKYSYISRQEANKKAEQENKEYIEWWKDYKDWAKKAKDLIKSNIKVVIPKGTELKVDRIYIRKGASDYSSITFFANLGPINIKDDNFHKTGYKVKKKLRFWAKLSDCNNIEFSLK